MESVLLYILGILIIVVGLAVSIGLHEVGHLVPAKLFGVKVTQYMIGFGRTLFSWRRGETEYGVKAIPLGGYISMIGMFPPTKPGERVHASSTGFFQQLNDAHETGEAATAAPAVEAPAEGTRKRRMFDTLVQDAREASAETIGEGEDDRAFYRLAVWKRIIIMLGGPAMNFVLAIVFYAIVLCGFGIPTASTTVASVSECVLPATSTATECTSDDPAAPGAEAGFLPGDRIVEIDGEAIANWDQISDTIRASAGTPLSVVVERDGEEVTLTLTPLLTERAVTDENGASVTDADGNVVTEEVGFAGISPTTPNTAQPVSAVLPAVGDNIASVVNIIVHLPERIVDVAQAAFGGQERDANGPISVVGVGRIAGEVASLDTITVQAKAQTMFGILASLNVALGVFNLIPLTPLDGGHVAAALWEALKKGWAKLFRRRDPGPVDAAKLMPVTFTVVVILGCVSALLIYADIVNPVDLLG